MSNAQPASLLPWIEVAKEAPYFVTEAGQPWTPIGQNDAITWPDLAGAFRRRDLPGVEGHLRWLASHGVTCLRLMLEYAHREHRYFERPVGRYAPNMVRLWDDLFALCERHGLRVLLTPYDTFWMWHRWHRHPYNRNLGGPCADRSNWLLCADTRAAIKARLAFVAERWGGSGALFAWDIWNEIHPAHAGDSSACFAEFVDDISGFLRQTEMRLYGRSHPQTVSVFGPVVLEDARAAECAFQHPALDFASIHLYEHPSINAPVNTVDAAVVTGWLVRGALAQIQDQRPFLDSEHGPIHTFKDHRVTLPEPFDDEYFRNMQWAHFASGGAGGGMRWPNRHPHTLTHGMRAAQRALAEFLPLIDWATFDRSNQNEEITVSSPALARFACSDGSQAVVWLLRTDTISEAGTMRADAAGLSACLALPGMRPGAYRVTAWDTHAGCPVAEFDAAHDGAGELHLQLPPIVSDLAFAIRRVGAA